MKYLLIFLALPIVIWWIAYPVLAQTFPDTDGDNDIDIVDFVAVVDSYRGSSTFDFDGNGQIDLFDLNYTVANYGSNEQVDWPVIGVEFNVVSNLTNPVFVTHAGDGSNRLFIVQRNGTIIIVKDGQKLTIPFLDISERVSSMGGEQGLLSLAFPPDFSDSQQFYVYYTNSLGDVNISRFRVGDNLDVADLTSEQILLNQAQPFANHNGGHMAFGSDGYLYISFGDGGSVGDPQNNAQNLLTLLGKIIRIDVSKSNGEYSIPIDNPYVSTDNSLDEIWVSGLRNPWRFSFDRLTGNMWIGDVGQNDIEEINFHSANSQGGENYGWRCYEGQTGYNTTNCLDQKNYVFPTFQHLHTNSVCSITGGYVYRGVEYPLLTGVYFYGDYCSGQMWGARPNNSDGFENKFMLNTSFSISSFGEDEMGELYIVDYGLGAIHKIIDISN